jgi:glucosamine--fructose-6-phosphate aminotransferase (isomerizing)
MLAQIVSLPDLIERVIPTHQSAIEKTITPAFCRSIERIYITGSGDSYHAALGSQLAFERLTGLLIYALPSLQFSRYAVEAIPATSPGSSLVIGISVSGEVSRVVESLRRARSAGALTLALTANPAGSVAQAAEWMIDSTQPAFEDPAGLIVPGVRSYVSNQIALLLIAVLLGEHRQQLDPVRAGNLRGEISGLAAQAAQTIEQNHELTAELARNWQDASEFVFAGSGPNYSSAMFSAAKVLEASGDPALAQDTEEWAHLQYFARQEDTPTILIGAAGRDYSRMAEVAAAAAAIGRRVAAVVPTSAAEITTHAAVHLPLSDGLDEMFSPVISAIPTSMFAAHRAEIMGEPYFRGFSGGRSIEGGGGISRIRTSQMLDLDLTD